MPEEEKYALWLMPEGELRERLSNLIGDLAAELSAPPFKPHITLLGGVRGRLDDIKQKTSELSSSLSPVEVRLSHLDYLDEYYKCLFIRVEETVEVTDAFLEARDFMRPFMGSLSPDAPMPHLSLLYGDFSFALKEELILRTGRTFDVKFTAGSIHLFSTKGSPEEWKQVDEFPLL
jgi:2'-5' RNA ligase